MGQAAKCNVAIFFNENEGVSLDVTSKTALQQSMLKHYYKTTPDAVDEPHIFISEFEQYENNVELEFYSSRRANLDFQIDLFASLLAVDETIKEITYDTWVQA